MNKDADSNLAARLVAFSLVFPLIYVAAFYTEWVVFLYYPLVDEFHLELQSVSLGPGMPYYGWVAAAAVGALVAVLLIPPRWILQIWPGWSWIAPGAAITFTLIYELRWLQHLF